MRGPPPYLVLVVVVAGSGPYGEPTLLVIMGGPIGRTHHVGGPSFLRTIGLPPRMTTQQVCARFGLTPAELNSCADRLQRDLEAAKARKRPQRAQGSLIRDPSDFWADEPFPW